MKTSIEYECWGVSELIDEIFRLRAAVNGLLDESNTADEQYEATVRAFEALGMTRSDAQACAEARGRSFGGFNK